ncbi:putative xyloglucan endotransglucosylase/hydrolase protein 23 [Zostera marina]|uniref:Xyloglucan endotransglucosylase/hydrolase n=1 Tax=Zostera marina TaxID=29655 RepID=A0A0K9NPG8_ZOSMR|nr:putative xyloglucan endotransglucosylase/hydrolase protein 23 [Zostera marina]
MEGSEYHIFNRYIGRYLTYIYIENKLEIERRKWIYLGDLLLLIDLLVLVSHVVADDFFNNVEITWGRSRGEIIDRGGLQQLSHDKISRSGFQSKQEYMFGRIDIQIKVLLGNLAERVTAYYIFLLSSILDGPFCTSPEPLFQLSDVSFQFAGTSRFLDGRYMDDVPIRVFRNVQEQLGVPYPKNQSQRVYSSLWNDDSWAIRSSLVKIDRYQALFTVSYQNFQTINACVFSNGKSLCRSTTSGLWRTTNLNASKLGKLQNVRKNNMIYDYYSDTRRFLHGLHCRRILHMNIYNL